MRTKLVSIVAILWVAAVGAISIAFAANRTEGETGTAFNSCIQSHEWNYCRAQNFQGSRTFETGGWLAWTGAVTLVALVALAIILVVFRGSKPKS